MKKMTTFEKLLTIKSDKGAGYFILLDPDKSRNLQEIVPNALDAGVDAFLVGGSLLMTPDFDQYMKTLKSYSKDTPVIIFPGGVNQISAHADAILFLSLLSGRNPHHLIGSQVMAAPIIHKLKMEAISTAYMLIESGRTTAAEFMSGTTPLPRHKIEIAVAHALAAEYLGFKLIYLEGGSGAEHSVPDEMIRAIAKTVKIPLIVGGGIRTPEEAAKKTAAGASFIVTGNILEKNSDPQLVNNFSKAIHSLQSAV
jgi:putative glycerol-1-phosphate prenyltransferase